MVLNNKNNNNNNNKKTSNVMPMDREALIKAKHGC